jgi:branched-chain amino acid transport system substrate-binding protein
MRIKSLFTVAGFALVLAGPPALAEILVGTAGPFSGPNAVLGEQIRRGTQQAIDDYNATGGLRGERLALKALDDECDPRKAVEVATELVTAGVTFVAGHYCSGASIPASKVYEKAGIVQISPASSHPRFTEDGSWNVIRATPRDDAQGSAAARLIADKFPKAKIAILSDQSPASTALVTKLREGLAAANLRPMLDTTFKPGAGDYADVALSVTEAGADLVYLAGSYVEGAAIAKALRGMGSAAQLMGGDALLTEDYWRLAGDAAEGTLVTFLLDPQRLESARTVISRFNESGDAPEGHTLYAYAAVQAWIQAAEATGSKDGARIAEWLRAGNRVQTVVGPMSFDAKGDLRDPLLAWFRWSKGRYAEVDPRTLEPPALVATP